MIARISALLVALSLWCGAKQPPPPLTKEVPLAKIQDGEKGPVIVEQGDSKEHSRPYIHPLRSPDGKHVLTQFSPGHHKHQTGLYWGQTRINGRDYFHHYKADYWKPGMNLQNAEKSMMDFRTTLLGAKGKGVLEDRQVWTYNKNEGYYTLDLDWVGTALVDVTIGKYDYGGLFLRMPWKRGVPAEVINSEGQKNGAGEGKPASWVDLGIKIEGMEKMAHVAMIEHPKNRGYPTLWRIDGQFGVGPALARRGDIKIPKGENLHYRYRLVVYEGDFDKALLKKEMARYGTE